MPHLTQDMSCSTLAGTNGSTLLVNPEEGQDSVGFFKKTVSIYQYFFSVQKTYSVSFATLCLIVSDDCTSMKQAVIQMTK